jgi:hypothetical protein
MLMKKVFLLFVAAIAAVGAQAQSSISLTGATPAYTQNFNTLDTATTSTTGGTTLPTGWSIFEYGSSSSVDQKYRAGAGASNSGDTYSFGSVQNTDRALGSIASGSLISNFGAKFTNNTGGTITGFTINLTVEQWRSGDTASIPDSTLFYYSTTATGINDTAASKWTAVSALDLNSVILNGGSNTGVALDGNAAANRTTRTGTVTGLTIADGSNLLIRWVDKNILGSDDGLAIDDLSMSFTGTGMGIADATRYDLPVNVLGAATSSNITVGFSAAKSDTYTVSVFDLSGREVSRNEVRANAGANRFNVANGALQQGMYIIRVSNGASFGVTKAIVE